MRRLWQNRAMRGALLCVFSAGLWGLSGTTGQYLFHNTQVSPEWLVSVRMLLTGVMLLAYVQVRNGGILSIWQDAADRKQLLLFSLLGMLFTQYCYFVAIRYANAATATVLQYLAPILIVIYLAIRFRRPPAKIEALAVCGALVGTFLLATHGNFHSLSISPKALGWGLASAVALAFYTVYPARLLQKYSSMFLIGWAMLLGGIVMNFIHPVWQIEGNWDTTAYFCLAFIVIFGTMLAYLLYLDGVRFVGPAKGSLYASAEPLASTLFSVLWLKTNLSWMDYIGFACIVGTVLMLSLHKPKETSSAPQTT